MTKTLTFNNGLFTGYDSSGSDMSTIKIVTFQNGLLTNVVDTSVSKTQHSGMTFSNGILTGITPLINPIPPEPPVENKIRIGEYVEHTLSITSYWGSQNIEDYYTMGGELYTEGNMVGYVLGVKDRVFTHESDPPYPAGYTYTRIMKDTPPDYESGFSLEPPNVYNDESYIFRPTLDSSWWDDPEIISSVYAKVPNIVSYTTYSDWCYQITRILPPPAVSHRNRTIYFGVTAVTNNISIPTYYQVTLFWAPIYYDE